MGGWIILALAVAFAFFAITIYNRLVALRNRYKNAFAQIDVQLKRRYDLIPNLVEAAKGYLAHERQTLEAVIAACYLDSGFQACRALVVGWYEPLLDALPPLHQVGKDAKTRLQEWLQARQLPRPSYELLAETGNEHDKTFLVSCTLEQPAMAAEGSGSSRRAAEQRAAESILEQLA